MKAMIIIEDTETGVTATALRIKTVDELNGNISDTGTSAGALCANLEHALMAAQMRAQAAIEQQDLNNRVAGARCLH